MVPITTALSKRAANGGFTLRRSPRATSPAGNQHKKYLVSPRFSLLGETRSGTARAGSRGFRGAHRHLPHRHSRHPPSSSRTFSIKGQSSLDEQSKFYRIIPPLRTLNGTHARLDSPLPPPLPPPSSSPLTPPLSFLIRTQR